MNLKPEKLIYTVAFRLGETDHRELTNAARELGVQPSPLARSILLSSLRDGSCGTAGAQTAASIDARLADIEHVASQVDGLERTLMSALELLIRNITQAPTSDVRDLIRKHFEGME